MGIFTWKFADDRRRVLQYGGCGSILLPDNTLLREPHYGGYGMFGSHDAYDVVTDMNKLYLKEVFEKLEKQNPRHFGLGLKELATAYSRDMEISGLIEDICRKYGEYLRKDWKRNIGITISAETADNASLPYPLKIVSPENTKKYEELKPSILTQ